MLIDSRRTLQGVPERPDREAISSGRPLRQTRETPEMWLRSGNEFMHYFEHGFARGHWATATFQLQLAAERYCTAVLVALSSVRPKVHNVEVLLRRCGELDSAFSHVLPRGGAEDERLLRLLKRNEGSAGPEPEQVVAAEDVALLRRRIGVLRDRAFEVCRDRAGLGPRTGRTQG